MPLWKGMVPSFEAVFFDFDGVLVDSEPVHFECWREIVAPFGLLLDWDVYCRDCIGVADRAMIEALCRQSSPALDFDRLWAEYPNKKRMFRERMTSRECITPAVRELIAGLADYKLAVVTSSGRAEVEPILEAAKLLPHFDTVVYGEDVARLKPAPDPYLLAARRLGVRRALVVEDSPAGIASGKAAGFDVAEVSSQSAMPALVLRSLGIKTAPTSLAAGPSREGCTDTRDRTPTD